MMTIGQVAERVGVNVQTVRFYERKGLIAPERRSSAGYRQFTGDTVRRIRFIKHAQQVGFSLKEIDELLSLKTSSEATCADIQARAFEKIDEIEQRMARLDEMRAALEALAQRCSTEKTLGDCPILDALEVQTKEMDS